MAEAQEKRISRRFALRLPVAVSYDDNGAQETSSQTRDVSARGISFFVDSPIASGSPIEFTLTLPAEITLTEAIRVHCKGKVRTGQFARKPAEMGSGVRAIAIRSLG